MQEESKEIIKDALLHPLTLFEISIVVRFLTTREKVLLLSLLNKKWKSFITQRYAWPSQLKPISRDFQIYYDFLSRLDSLEGLFVHLPWSESQNLKLLAKLAKVSEISLTGILSESLEKLVQYQPQAASRITHVEITGNQYCLFQPTTIEGLKALKSLVVRDLLNIKQEIIESMKHLQKVQISFRFPAMKLKTKIVRPSHVCSDLDFSEFSQLLDLNINVQGNSYPKEAIIDKLAVPESLTSLTLGGIKVGNIQQVIERCKKLKYLELSLGVGTQVTGYLPPDLMEYVIHLCYPPDIVDLNARCEGLQSLKLININNIQKLELQNYKSLKEMVVQVTHFTSLKFIALPSLESLRVRNQEFKFQKGLSVTEFQRDTETWLPRATSMISGPLMIAKVSSLPPGFFQDFDLSALKHLSLSIVEKGQFAKITGLFAKAVNLERLNLINIRKQKEVNFTISHPKLRVLKLGQDEYYYNVHQTLTMTLKIEKECTALSSVQFLSNSHKLEMHLSKPIQRLKIVAKETDLKIAKGVVVQNFSILGFKSTHFKFLSHVKYCFINLESISVFTVPQCPFLKILNFDLHSPPSLRLLKLVIQKANSLEELKLTGLNEKTDEIIVESDSLKIIDLRQMEKLSYIKLKGKAQPVKLGFKRTKLIVNKK